MKELDFESSASTIPPQGHAVPVASGERCVPQCPPQFSKPRTPTVPIPTLAPTTVYHHINTHVQVGEMARSPRSSGHRPGNAHSWRRIDRPFAPRRRNSRTRRNHRCRTRARTGPQNEHPGSPPLREVQAMAAQSWSVGRSGSSPPKRATAAIKVAISKGKRGLMQLTLRPCSTIGAHDSGCLQGGPFSLNSNLKA